LAQARGLEADVGRALGERAPRPAHRGAILRGAVEQGANRVRERAPVELAGALDPAAVRALLETADLLAMPCVVAADGDRDSMPVVVKEALAMEVCVVASDEVGLPEIVRPPWGALVAPVARSCSSARASSARRRSCRR
ncbi:MAG: glycosyltransferase, partial [Marmoricola sp.]